VVSEEGDLDVAAVGVERGGSSLKGAVGHGMRVCHYGRAPPHAVSPKANPAEDAASARPTAVVPMLAVCSDTGLS
jgi:hypothetical protein